MEYIFDTLDYIQLHQEEFGEFQQLASQLLQSIDGYQSVLPTVTDTELNSFDDQIEKLSEQVELLNQKGEFLLQSSASGDEDNQVGRLLDNVNRNYDLLILKIKTRLESEEGQGQAAEISFEQVEREASRRSTSQSSVQIVPTTSNPRIDELRDHLEEMNLALNALSELLITTTSETPSTQALLLSEQFRNNSAIRTEVDRRRNTLDRLQVDIQTLRQATLTEAERESVKGNLDRVFQPFKMFNYGIFFLPSN